MAGKKGMITQGAVGQRSRGREVKAVRFTIVWQVGCFAWLLHQVYIYPLAHERHHHVQFLSKAVHQQLIIGGINLRPMKEIMDI